MYSHIQEHLQSLEIKANSLSAKDVVEELRLLGLGDFVYMMSMMPISKFPILSSKLPAMASDEVCQTWTGNTGQLVMEQAIDFTRSCATTFTSITGSSLDGKRILDFGCGYGRLLRCFQFFTHDVSGVDAWEASLQHCRAAGLGGYVFQSDEIPEALPAPGKFELLTAFSVFTHLSEESAIASLESLRKSANAGSILALTIRPPEFWQFAVNGSLSSRKEEVAVSASIHAQDGFAFLPHIGAKHYGDTTLTVEWLRSAAKDWDVVSVDRSGKDQLQRYVFLMAR